MCSFKSFTALRVTVFAAFLLSLFWSAMDFLVLCAFIYPLLANNRDFQGIIGENRSSFSSFSFAKKVSEQHWTSEGRNGGSLLCCRE